MRFYFFLLLMIVFSCKKADLQINPEQNELQEWLAKEGKYFAKGEMKVSITNSLVTGKLDWSQVTHGEKNGYEFWSVPFVFSVSSNGAKKIITDNGNLPTNFYLIFRKRSNGSIEARMRMRSLKKGNSFEGDIVYESYYGLDGNYVAEIRWRDKKLSLLTENSSSSSTQRNSGCTSEISSTSTFYCAGNTPNTTVCYYTIKRNVKLKCDFDPTPEQQEEPISWIAVDDYWLGWQETEVTETQTIKKTPVLQTIRK